MKKLMTILSSVFVFIGGLIVGTLQGVIFQPDFPGWIFWLIAIFFIFMAWVLKASSNKL
jgi:hypothetical protein